MAKPVALGIFLAEHRIARSNFNSGNVDRWIADDGAKGRNARSNTCLKNGFAGYARHCGGEEYGINTGAIALLGLKDAEPAAQKRILSQRLRHG
jgi:hypothetical protein